MILAIEDVAKVAKFLKKIADRISKLSNSL